MENPNSSRLIGRPSRKTTLPPSFTLRRLPKQRGIRRCMKGKKSGVRQARMRVSMDGRKFNADGPWGPVLAVSVARLVLAMVVAVVVVVAEPHVAKQLARVVPQALRLLH